MSNTKNDILLTIAIPTYRRPKFLVQAIQSALGQNMAGFSYEVIVVNNDSDSDMSTLRSMFSDDTRVQFFTNEKNIGMIGNVNRCLQYAKGEYIAYLHDDDLLLPNYIQEISPIIEEKKYACVIPERYLLFEREDIDERFEVEERRKKKEVIRSLIVPQYFTKETLTELHVEDNVFAWQNCYCAPTCGVLFRKQALLDAGLFFPEGTYSWDFYSFLALNKRESIYILHKPISIYRVTSGATLRAEVQYDFYKSFEDLIEMFPEGTAVHSFIKKYRKEIKYLNYCSLNPAGKEYLLCRTPNIETSLQSKWKYRILMLRRIWYYSVKHLEVERVLDRKGVEMLQSMQVLRKGD